VGPTLLVGLYVVLHGHQTPGGGFQGGVILASALLLTYLSDRYTTLRRVGPLPILELGEGAGALGLVLLGLLGLVAGEAFFENVLPLGVTGTLLSAGTIEPGNVAVAFAVAGGFSFMLVEFLEQTLVRRRRRRRPRDVRRGRR
jgi:multicomponent Na+:H+ antiporter subunit B